MTEEDKVALAFMVLIIACIAIVTVICNSFLQ